jgi:8-oxo-dGTP pyrophosphatase MutT (NUDIX family)
LPIHNGQPAIGYRLSAIDKWQLTSEAVVQLTDAVEIEELEGLQQRWGPFAVQTAALVVADPFLSDKDQRIATSSRRAEICYIMQRGDSRGDILLHIKTFYPQGAFRLPTGGIQPGEPVEETLAREIDEETGLTVGDHPGQVRVEACLGVLHYNFEHARLGLKEFATYHFLVRMPEDGVIAPRDEGEQIGGWRWVAPGSLGAVADTLDAVRLRGDADATLWGDWGRFRAASHRFVAKALE